MEIFFTRHAKEMLRERVVEKGQVEKCLENPDLILPAKKDRQAYLKKFGEHYLKIIITKSHKIFIITCYWLDKKRVKI